MTTYNYDFLNIDLNTPTNRNSVSEITDSVEQGGESAGANLGWSEQLKKRRLEREQKEKEEKEKKGMQLALSASATHFQEIAPPMPPGSSVLYFAPGCSPTVNVSPSTPSAPVQQTETPGARNIADISPSDSGDTNIKNFTDMAETMRSVLREIWDFQAMKTFMIAMHSLSLRAPNPQFINLATWSVSSLLSGVFAILFILAVNVFWTVYVHVWDNVIPSQLFFVSDMLVVMTTLGVYKTTTSLFGWRKRTAFLYAFFICTIMSCVKPNVKYFDSTIPDLFNNIPRSVMEKKMFSIDRNFNLITPIVQIFKLRICHGDRENPMCVQALSDISLYMPKYENLIMYMGNQNLLGLPETVYSLRLPEKVHSEVFLNGNSESKSKLSFNLDEVRKLEEKEQVPRLLYFLFNRFQIGLYLEHVYKDSVNMYNTFRHALSATTAIWNWLDKMYLTFLIDPISASFNRLITMLGTNSINFILMSQDFETWVLEKTNYWHYIVNHRELPHHRANFSLLLNDGGLNRPKDLARVENHTFEMCTFHPCVLAQSIKSHNVKIATMTQNLKKKIPVDQHAEFLNMTVNDMRHTEKILKEMEKNNTCQYTDDQEITSMLLECPDIVQVSLLLAGNEISRNPALTNTMCPPACLNTYVAGCAPIVEDLDNSTPTLHKEKNADNEDREDSLPLPDFSWRAYMETVLGYFVVFLQHSLSMGFGYMCAVLAIFIVLFIYDHFKTEEERRHDFRHFLLEHEERRRNQILQPSHHLEAPRRQGAVRPW
jgi:hypothetical protein